MISFWTGRSNLFGEVFISDMCLMLNAGGLSDPWLISVRRLLANRPSTVEFRFFSSVLPTKVRRIYPPRLLSSGLSFVVAICYEHSLTVLEAN